MAVAVDSSKLLATTEFSAVVNINSPVIPTKTEIVTFTRKFLLTNIPIGKIVDFCRTRCTGVTN